MRRDRSAQYVYWRAGLHSFAAACEIAHRRGHHQGFMACRDHPMMKEEDVAEWMKGYGMRGHAAQSGPIPGAWRCQPPHAVLSPGFAARPSRLVLDSLVRALSFRGRAFAGRKPTLGRPPALSETAVAMHVHHVFDGWDADWSILGAGQHRTLARRLPTDLSYFRAAGACQSCDSFT